jgi:hypothetical protein
MGGIFGKWSPSTLHLILFAAGGGLLYLGEDWGIPGATEIGLGVIGLFLIVIGIDIIIKRMGAFRIDGWTQAHVVDMYRSAADLLWGLVFLCLGLVVTALVLMSRFGPVDAGSFWGNLLNTAEGLGTILAFVGLMLLLNGLIRALAGSGNADPRRIGGLANVLDRVAGAAVFLVGAGIATSGLTVLLAPDVARGAVQRLMNLLAGG